MRYALALVSSWWWHLTYGMWRGYRETRTYMKGTLVTLTSTDAEHRVVKVFWGMPLPKVTKFKDGSICVDGVMQPPGSTPSTD